MKQSQFLEKLAAEAALQAKIHTHPVVPRQLEKAASVIGRHTWVTLMILSGLMALLREVFAL